MSDSFLTDVENFVSVRHDTYNFISSSKIDLSGKSVFVTGATGGIGKATAIRFAAAGCSRIALGARSPLGEVEALVHAAAVSAHHPPPLVLALTVDVTSPESVEAAATTLAERFGSLDILVANAGTMEAWRPIAEACPTEWWKTWEVNVQGIFLCARFFIPLLLKSQTKTLISVASAGAYKLGIGASAYNTSKLAVCRFAEFVGHEYSSQGFVSISVHPGGVKTATSMKLPEYLHTNLLDNPDLAADTIVWLGAQRREWLSGRYLSSNWDMEDLEKRREEILQRDLLKFRVAV